MTNTYLHPRKDWQKLHDCCRRCYPRKTTYASPATDLIECVHERSVCSRIHFLSRQDYAAYISNVCTTPSLRDRIMCRCRQRIRFSNFRWWPDVTEQKMNRGISRRQLRVEKENRNRGFGLIRTLKMKLYAALKKFKLKEIQQLSCAERRFVLSDRYEDSHSLLLPWGRARPDHVAESYSTKDIIWCRPFGTSPLVGIIF